MMAADVSSIARMLRGEERKRGAARPEMVTMDLLGGCGGGGAAAAGRSDGEDEVVDLEVKVPTGWERRLDLLSGKTFLTPRRQGIQGDHQDLKMRPPAAAASASSAAVCTLDMVRSALDRAAAVRSAASPATSSSSSSSTSSSSSSVGKHHRSPPASTTAPSSENPSMRAAACPSCLTYVLIIEADPRCPRCAGRVPPPALKPSATAAAAAVVGGGKKPRIDLNAAADDTE